MKTTGQKKAKLDWQTSKIPTTGRIAAVSDEGCGYWAALPETMSLHDAADAFGTGYDYNDYEGTIECNATLIVDGREIESLDFTLTNHRTSKGEDSRAGYCAM